MPLTSATRRRAAVGRILPYWTGREDYVKALGAGLMHTQSPAADWSLILIDLDAAPDYAEPSPFAEVIGLCYRATVNHFDSKPLAVTRFPLVSQKVKTAA